MPLDIREAPRDAIVVVVEPLVVETQERQHGRMEVVHEAGLVHGAVAKCTGGTKAERCSDPLDACLSTDAGGADVLSMRSVTRRSSALVNSYTQANCAVLLNYRAPLRFRDPLGRNADLPSVRAARMECTPGRHLGREPPCKPHSHS